MKTMEVKSQAVDCAVRRQMQHSIRGEIELLFLIFSDSNLFEYIEEDEERHQSGRKVELEGGKN